MIKINGGIKMSKVIMRKDKLGQLKERIIYDDFNEYCEKNIKFIHSRVNLIYNKYNLLI